MSYIYTFEYRGEKKYMDSDEVLPLTSVLEKVREKFSNENINHGDFYFYHYKLSDNFMGVPDIGEENYEDYEDYEDYEEEIKSPDIQQFITFKHQGREVGRFSIINGKLEFSGDTDISAQMFVDKVVELFNNQVLYEKIKEMCFKGESENNSATI